MSDQQPTPNFRHQSNFLTGGEAEEEEAATPPLFPPDDQFDRMQSSFDSPFASRGGDASDSREWLQDADELATTVSRMMSMEEPEENDEEEDRFEMTPNESRIDLEILSPIKLSSLLSTQLERKSGNLKTSEDSSVARRKKVVEFANFDDTEPAAPGKTKRTDSTGEAAVQAKIFAEIRK